MNSLSMRRSSPDWSGVEATPSTVIKPVFLMMEFRFVLSSLPSVLFPVPLSVWFCGPNTGCLSAKTTDGLMAFLIS